MLRHYSALRVVVVSVVALSYSSLCLAADIAVERLYVVGDSRTIEMARPKHGYVGYPHILTDSRPLFKTPFAKEHFDRGYFRIAVSEKGADDDGTTTALLRMDELDAAGELLKADVYIVRLTIADGIVDLRYGDQRIRMERAFEGWGRDFPFSSLQPPTPRFQYHQKARHCRVVGMLGAEHTFRYWQVGSSWPRAVHVTVFERPAKNVVLEEGRPDVRYFKEGAEALSDSPEADSSPVLLKYTDEQVWGSAEDWLWRRMERRDAKGNVLMRCRQVKLPLPEG